MKTIVKLVAAAAVVAAVVEVLRRRPAPPTASPTAPPNQWTPGARRPDPTDAPAETTAPTAETVPEPTADTDAAAGADAGTDAPAWVEPNDDGTCPEGHPVKAKTSSRIFHVPGGAMYERTTPDRCYASAEAAEADGYRASQR